jgi:beta-glucosidase-like glycosyl hydrolase
MREIARLLLPSVRWDPARGMAAMRPGVERAIDAGVGGFVLDPMPVAGAGELTAFIRQRADEAPLLVIDPAALDEHHGDAVDFSLPPPAALASLRDTHAVRRAARVTARAVRRTGCNAILGPPCDVAGAPRTDAFSADPSAVALAASEWIDAAQSDGVLCVAGNFPGEGRVRDHLDAMPVVRVPEDALYASDLVPYRAVIDTGVAGVAMASAAYPVLEPSGMAAALSARIITRVLRGELGFEGLVVADSAVIETRAQRAVSARELVRAGVDLVLRTSRLDVDLRALLDGLQDGELDRERVHDAARRRRERAELAGAPLPIDATLHEDSAWMDELAERTIAVVRGRAVRPEPPIEVVVVSESRVDRGAVVRSFADGIAQAGGDPAAVRHVHVPTASSRPPLVVIAVPSGRVAAPDLETGGRIAAELASVGSAARRARRSIAVVWCGHPVAPPAAADADLVIACWNASASMLRAAGRWMMRRV